MICEHHFSIDFQNPNLSSSAMNTHAFLKLSLLLLLTTSATISTAAPADRFHFIPTTSNFTWSPRLGASWYLPLSSAGTDRYPHAPVFYGGWSPRRFIPSDIEDHRDLDDAWLLHSNLSWSVHPVSSCLQVSVECPGDQASPGLRSPWPRGHILQPLSMINSSLHLAWEAWRVLIARPLDPSERATCLQKGQLRYYLQACPGWDLASYPELLAHPGWSMATHVPRYGALTAVHYNNSYLNGDDIYYVLGGTISQPDGRDHQLRDLWASRDGGQSWIPIRNRLPWSESMESPSLAISPLGVIVATVAKSTLPSKDELWVSLDGGQTWGLCTEQAGLGIRSHATLGFDVDGYLYVVGGSRAHHRNRDHEVMRSSWSFNDFWMIRHHCGKTAVPTGERGGLEVWTGEAEIWPMAPQPGRYLNSIAWYLGQQ